jgi:serine beta-lactamase-like protein LACTB, mitochondrial
MKGDFVQHSMTRRSFTLGAVATPFVAATVTQTPTPPASTTGSHAAADAVADALHAANPTPALSLAVARSTGPLWTRVYGKADLGLDVPTSPNHLFRLGSVSKVLTATVAARLVSQGVVDLDAPISEWLPDLPAQHRDTTLRQLLTHRGGIRHYTDQDLDPAAPGGAIYQRIYPTNDDILALFINDPLVAQPGAEVSYSSFGFTLASLVMEAAAGRPFPELLVSEVGSPLGLRSLAIDNPFVITPLRVSGYSTVEELASVSPDTAAYWSGAIEGQWANAPQFNPAYAIAGGGLLMTPSDTARFGAAMVPVSRSVLSQEEKDLLFTPIPEAPMGLAWRIDADDQGRLRWHHAGATGGGRASLVVYPDLDLSIALASNVATIPGDVLQPSSALADAFS